MNLSPSDLELLATPGELIPMADADDERRAIVAYIRKRGASAVAIAKRGQTLLTEGEAKRLERWLEALAGDVAAGLHVD